MTRDEWITAYMMAHSVNADDAYAAYALCMENDGSARKYCASDPRISSIERAAAAAAASAQSMTDKNKVIPIWAWLGLAGVAAWMVWRS
jgi:hypothetical protein